MTREDYYRYYQANIEMLNIQIEQVKNTARSAIGKNAWQVSHQNDPHQISKSNLEVLAATRLYSFLICSWFEARLMKILYENSSVAFSDTEIISIRNLDNMKIKWKTIFQMAICKSYNIQYIDEKTDYSSSLPVSSVSVQNYKDVLILMPDIEDAITIRNRLAHGQWAFQFNGNNTALASYSFLSTYDNIQILDILHQCFEHIANIISSFITYKDKSAPKFDNNIQKQLDIIRDKKKRIEKMDYSKYVAQCERAYASDVQMRKSVFEN